MTAILSVRNLSKNYGQKRTVQGISFEVRQNEIVGLLGPNGAGKTTTINMILGLVTPSGGEILMSGHNIAQKRANAIAQTNFAAVYSPLPGNLTVAQNLKIFGLLYSVKSLAARIETLLEEYDLIQFRDTKCGVLSSGEQTRVSLAKAMLNQPPLLLLDEPTASLDPATARDIRSRIRSFASGGTSSVLWTSHNMLEVEEMCDRVLFMSKGEILLSGNPKTLPQEHGKSSLEELFIAVAREPLTLEGLHA